MAFQNTQTISLEELLEEVSVGNYFNFQTYLKNNHITKLHLSEKVVGLDLTHLAASLINTIVTSVNLRLNQIDAENATNFIAMVKDTNLLEIDLSFNEIDEHIAADFVANLKGTKVIEVNLKGNQIGAQGVATFITNLKDTNVTKVNLSSNEIGDQGAAAVAVNLKDTNVIWVDLSDNEISDQGATAVAASLQGSKLIYIDLNDNEIGDQGAAAIAASLRGSKLTHICLGYNRIKNPGAAAIAESLQNTKLTQIDLSFNQIGDQGAIAFIDNLKNTIVSEVNLNENELSERALKQLKDALIVQAHATPYWMVKLNQCFPLNKTEKNKFINKKPPFRDTQKQEQRACNIIRALPPELAVHVASFVSRGESFNDRDHTLQAPLLTFFNTNADKSESILSKRKTRRSKQDKLARSEAAAFLGNTTLLKTKKRNLRLRKRKK